MDIYENIVEFYLQIVEIAYSILEAINATTIAIETMTEEDLTTNIVFQYLGYVIDAIGRPLWTIFITLIQISLGLTIYSTFLKGIHLVKETVLRIKK